MDVGSPSDGAMDGLLPYDIIEVDGSILAFIWVNPIEERGANDFGRLFFEVVFENGVEEEDLEVGVEQSPV